MDLWSSHSRRADHVEMADQQNGFVLTRSMQTYDDILLTIIRPEHLDVAVGKSGVAETLRHCFRRCRYAADRVGGVDFD